MPSPLNPVICPVCALKRCKPGSAMCLGCFARKRPNPQARYPWTSLQDQLLRAAYQGAHNKKELSASITDLQRRFRVPRYMVTHRAAELGVCREKHTHWSNEEITRLRELAGSAPTRHIAKRMHRGYWSVKSKLEALGISGRVTEGYSIDDLIEMFGVTWYTLHRWIGRGWLRVSATTERVREEEVRRFLRHRPEEWSMKKINEAWAKGLLFDAFGMRRESEMRAGHRDQRDEELSA